MSNEIIDDNNTYVVLKIHKSNYNKEHRLNNVSIVANVGCIGIGVLAILLSLLTQRIWLLPMSSYISTGTIRLIANINKKAGLNLAISDIENAISNLKKSNEQGRIL
ncbi:MAG: hypothetical protein LBC82_02350 [Oscillospiraceae bacterium]|jgi:hypothetical protein|nr:hypothetical protein [Oscillospiraceae bacterium]